MKKLLFIFLVVLATPALAAEYRGWYLVDLNEPDYSACKRLGDGVTPEAMMRRVSYAENLAFIEKRFSEAVSAKAAHFTRKTTGDEEMFVFAPTEYACITTYRIIQSEMRRLGKITVF